jgi:hypothetical protein
MIADDTYAAFDSNILTYFLEAASGLYDPARDSDDNLRPERVSAYRLFLFGVKLVIVPTVTSEAAKIPKEEKRREHLSWIYNQMEVLPQSSHENEVATRQARYEQLHPKGQMDCRAVAEAESDSDVQRFLTFDRDLLRCLAGKTERITIQTPSQCWAELAILPGTPSKWVPGDGNPLAAVDWWRW